MSEDTQNWIQFLEAEWGKPDGFLGKAREGIFDVQHGAIFVSRLAAIKLPPDAPVDRRLVSLVWYIPIFLWWQQERISQHGGDSIAFETLSNRVQEVGEEILGVP